MWNPRWAGLYTLRAMTKPWYADGLRFTCTQCGDCCRTHGEYAHVFLSVEDVTRLAGFLKMDRKEFLREYTVREDEVTWRLAWPEEACIFLGEKGCTVYEGRPMQCRTWPFWPENLKKKVWETEVVADCPGAGEGRLYKIGEIRRLSRGEGETGA